jgi:hypothetical protein
VASTVIEPLGAVVGDLIRQSDARLIRLASLGLGIPRWVLFTEILKTGCELWFEVLRVGIEGRPEERAL